MRNFRELWPLYCGQKVEDVIKIYSFADKIKQFCQECLGLTHAQVWGSDADKNTLTELRWEDMPGVITPDKYNQLNNRFRFELNSEEDKLLICDELSCVYHEPGIMTARAVMQFFGTEICRRMKKNIWAEACLRQIKTENLPVALICDMRFPNEVEEVKKHCGICIRLTRSINTGDKHASETSLDNDKFSWSNFDAIIDNKYMTVQEQNKALVNMLKNLCFIANDKSITS